MTTTLYQGHALEVLRGLEAGSVQACLTSPPYWGLRDYHCPLVSWPDGWHGSLGLEADVASYILHLVAIFREVKRVLRDDAILFVNIADSYAGTGKSGGGRQWEQWAVAGMEYLGPRGGKWYPPPSGTRQKSLCLIPQRLAIALQDDGWILRQVFPWVKRNCMPGSQQDRPTNALEWWLMCVQQPRYYCDMESIRQPAIYAEHHEKYTSLRSGKTYNSRNAQNLAGDNGGLRGKLQDATGRTYRNTDLWFASLAEPYGLVGVGDELVGLDVPTRAGPAGHYATFSPELITPLLQMATSARGACSACGSPWRRVLERTPMEIRRTYNHPAELRTRTSGTMLKSPESRTTGWQSQCACDAPTRPCVVLDPFAGRGTAGLAAQRLGLDAVLIELNASDIAASRQRLAADAPLLAHITEGSLHV